MIPGAPGRIVSLMTALLHRLAPAIAGAVCVFALSSAFAQPGYAQTAAAGDVSGTVRDSTGGVLPGATLVLANIETGVERTSVTNETGRFRIPAVAAGAYTLTVSLDGFATVQRAGLTLEVGQVLAVDVALPPAGVSQEVTVTADAPVIEPGRTQTGAVVSRTEIENLPSNGRDFLSFSTQVAGVTGQQMSGQGSGISFNGQRARSNNISVDGVDANGALNGNTRLTLSQEAVREFQVVTSQFAPEFGRAAGGLVNIVSRSGTNDFRGNAFLYVRDESMDARNAFVTEGKPQFERQNYGGTFGGPLKRNRTFFFGAVERMQRDESGVITISDSAVAAINAVLAARPIPNAGVTSIATGVYPITRRDTLVSFKLDHTLNANNTLAFRYTYGESNEGNAGGVGIGGLVDESGGGGQRNTDQSFLGTWTQVISPALLGELRVQVAPRDLTQYANDEVGPRVSISGVATWGRNTNFPVILDETTTQGSYTMSWQRGRHFVKFGGDIAHISSTSSFPVSFAGSFTFGSLATFTAGTPTTFTQGFGNPQIDLPDTMYAAFAQDSWSLSDRLTLVYGLRYDYDAQPQNVPRDRSNPIEAPLDDGIHRDGNNVSPRAGFTWDPIGGGRTLIRGGYGRFYDKVFLLVARNALLARQSISLSGANAAAQFREGAFPESEQLPPGFSLARPSINVSDPEMQIPYVDQVSLGVERQFGRDWSAAVNVVRNWGADLLVSDNTNLGPPTVLTSANAPSLGVSNPSAQQLGRPYLRIHQPPRPALQQHPDGVLERVVVVLRGAVHPGEAILRRLLRPRELHPVGGERRRVRLHAGRAAQRPLQPRGRAVVLGRASAPPRHPVGRLGAAVRARRGRGGEPGAAGHLRRLDDLDDVHLSQRHRREPRRRLRRQRRRQQQPGPAVHRRGDSRPQLVRGSRLRRREPAHVQEVALRRSAGAAAAVRGVQPVQPHELQRHQHDVGHDARSAQHLRRVHVGERASPAPAGGEIRVLMTRPTGGRQGCRPPYNRQRYESFTKTPRRVSSRSRPGTNRSSCHWTFS